MATYSHIQITADGLQHKIILLAKMVGYRNSNFNGISISL